MNIQKIILSNLIGAAVIGTSSIASAGFLDTFNRASQTLSQTTSSIENTQRNVERAGNILPKTKKVPATPKAAEVTKETTGTLTAKDKAAIEKAKRAWVAAFKAEDWDALVDQYSENAVLLPPDEETKTGHEAIRENFNTDEDTSNEVFDTIEINGDANIAYVQGVFSFTISSANTSPVNASGKYIEIWEKQTDGTWLITHDIWNATPAAQ